MSEHAFFSHTTAAQLLQIPLPQEFDSVLPLHVSTVGDLRGPTAAGVTGHHLHVDGRDIRTYAGLRMTTPERTVLDLAAQLDDESLLGALDNVLWWRRGSDTRATARSLSETFGRFKGRRGRSRLLELMPLACERSDSQPESAFRFRFRNVGFPPALPNANIYDAFGRFIAMPDLQFLQYRMAFDYEGDHHRTDKRQWRKDLQRVPRLQDEGWHHTRISAADLADPREMLARTARLLSERGWRG